MCKGVCVYRRSGCVAVGVVVCYYQCSLLRVEPQNVQIFDLVGERGIRKMKQTAIFSHDEPVSISFPFHYDEFPAHFK